MAGIDDESVECQRCGLAIGPGDATEIVVRQDHQVQRTVLCPDCSELECPNCGTHVPFGAGAGHRFGLPPPIKTVTCVKCDDEVPPAEAAQLRNRNNPQYRKTLCADCLKGTAVPEGFVVVRDFTPDMATE